MVESAPPSDKLPCLPGSCLCLWQAARAFLKTKRFLAKPDRLPANESVFLEAKRLSGKPGRHSGSPVAFLEAQLLSWKPGRFPGNQKCLPETQWLSGLMIWLLATLFVCPEARCSSGKPSAHPAFAIAFVRPGASSPA